MLHHYNYASPLSHFLSYHQLQGQDECSNGQTTPNSVCEDLGPQMADRFKSVNGATNGKSFTIAAILGLKPDGGGEQNTATDLTTAVVNLSVHQGMTTAERNTLVSVSDCSRLQLPVMRNHPTATANVPYPAAGNVCHQQPPPPHHHQQQQQQQRTVRGLKHVPSSGPNGGPSNAVNKKSSSSKSKRVRTIFTPEQLERLEAEFERQQYMVGPERLYLAHTLQLTEAQVKVWFQNRRIKWRKHHLEITHQRLAAIKQQQLQQQLLGDTNTDTMDSNNSSGTDT